MNQQTCKPAWLDAYLKNELNESEEQMLTSHLDECSDCREELESRAAEQSVWREASSLLGGGILLSTAAISDIRSGTVRSPQIELVLQQLAPTDDPESLGRIGGYEVTGVVGAGGMGVVLKAHDRSLDRIVAIKVMSPHLASSGSARRRFAREAKAAAAVLHPNVIAIHSVASEDASPYLVMPYVRGASLQKRIDSQGPLPLKDTLRIGAQIAAGLAAAHEQGLVHRDIKPANILLEEGVERVTITDFGLARAVDDASMTCSGVIAGTPQYMSPEQARGEPIDARSDLFSLGGVLYAMCTGRSPFRAETTYGVLHRIANDNPTPVCEVNTDVPVWLGHLIERLMAKRPEDRFESAAQVAELLEGCLAHVQQPAAMPLPEAVASLAPQKTRRPPIGMFIAAAAGACALIFAGILIVLELGKGTLTIESELDNIPIRISQGEKIVERLTISKSGASIRVTAGNYLVELDGKDDDSIELRDGTIKLLRGQTEVVRLLMRRTTDENAADTDLMRTLAQPTPNRFSDTQEIVLSIGTSQYMLDLDTGEAIAPQTSWQSAWPNFQSFQFDLHPTQEQPQQVPRGLSFPYTNTTTFPYDNRPKLVPVSSDLWNQAVSDVLKAIPYEKLHHAVQDIPLKKTENTYFFQTMGGTQGLLMLVGTEQFPNATWGMRIRYKTLRHVDLEREASAVKRVMQYLSAVKASDTELSKSISKGLRVHEQRDKDIVSLLQEGGIPELYKSDYENYSAKVALGPVTSSDKQMNGRYLFFALSLVDERWSIVDIDLEVQERLLERFKNPPPGVDAPHGITNAKPLENEHNTSSKSSPEFPPVKIVVHDEEGKPLEGVKISLHRVAKDQGSPVLEINEISTANGLAVNRSLPYGHYDLSARTSDGWVLHHGIRLNVEFEKGLDVVLVAPTTNKTAKLVINSDLGLPSAAVNELRFGELQEGNGPGYSVPYAPEPVAKPIDGETETTREGASTKRASLVNGASYDSFPSIVNGIEYVGVEIDTEITRSIPQAAVGLKHIHTTWEWYPTESDQFKSRYLVANNQARGFMDDKDLHLSPVDASQFFKMPGPSYRVGASALKLGAPTALPLELEIPAGDVKVYIGRFYGKPNAASLAALNWRQQEKKSELWLKAHILRESAWIERLMSTTGWVYSAPGEGSYIVSGHLLRQEASVTAGETLKISLGPKQIDPKTSSESAARTLDDITAKPQTEQVIDALVTFEFVGLVGKAKVSTSGIGWVIDQRGHILVPDEMAPRSENYSIEVRYADGSRTSANRVFNFGHLALLKPEKPPAILPIRLSSQRVVQDGDQVLAILNGTDVQKGTVTSAKKTIQSSDSWPVRYVPPLRFPNAIETDFKSDAASLFGAPLLAPSGEVVGMLLNYKPPMFAIPLSEIQIACREFESSQKQTPQAAVKATHGTTSESSTPHEKAKIIVDVYGGSRVLGQDNAKYGKLVQALDAIDDVQVNFREAGPGSDIALAIVRDPNGLMNQEANSTGKPSTRRDAISKALEQVPSVRWEEGSLRASLQSNQPPAEQLFQDAMEEATADEAYQAMEKLLASAKMDWKSTERYIAMVATRMTSDIEFAKHVLEHFRRACAGGESTYQARRNLLAVLTKVFHVWGQSRWSTDPASIQQQSNSNENRPQEIRNFEVSALEAIVSYGHKATRSDIVDFVRAARALHHPDAKPFLQDVALNPQNPSPHPYTPPVTNRTNSNLHVWRDNLGGTWADARFVAAVGLAELGDQTAIEWLLDKAKPNDFGLDESINLSHHERDRTGSLRESSRCTLIDLFGQPKDSTVAQLSDWWTSNRSQVTPRVVRLKSDFATKTVTPLERSLANARSVVEAYVASAISGDVAQAAELAKNSPADPKRIRELPEFLNVQRLKIETVYINDPAKPTQALATSVAVKLDEEHKNPDGRRDGFMVFTLELTDDKWLVTDIDFESESGAEKELNKFLKANPNSIGIPPQS